jgi:hypothetical protein
MSLTPFQVAQEQRKGSTEELPPDWLDRLLLRVPGTQEEKLAAVQETLKRLHKKKKTAHLDYLKFLLSPMDTPPVKPPNCIPLPTNVIRYSQSGNFATSGAQVQWVMFCPQYSGQIVMATSNAPGGAITTQLTGAVYPYAAYSGGIRVIASELRISYVGQELYIAGYMVGSALYAPSTGLPFTGAPSESLIRDGLYAKTVKMNDGFRCVWFPKDSNDTSFADSTGVSGAKQLWHNIFIGNAVNGQLLHYDIVTYYEILPVPAYGELFTQTQSAIDNIVTSGKADSSDWLDFIANALGKVPSFISSGLSFIEKVGSTANAAMGAYKTITGSDVSQMDKEVEQISALLAIM